MDKLKSYTDELFDMIMPKFKRLQHHKDGKSRLEEPQKQITLTDQ
jgi:hypothetical protein